MSNFLDVVDHGEELPLHVDLPSAAQRETPHPLVLDVRKHRLDRSHPPAVGLPTPRCIEFPSHAFGGRASRALRARAFATFDDRDLPLPRALGMAQTTSPKRTVSTRRDRCFEVRDPITVEEHVL